MIRRALLVSLLLVGCATMHPRASSASVLLGWTDNTAGSGQTQIERKQGTGVYAALVTVPPGVTQYTDTTTVPSTAYCYRARAIVGTAVSAYSIEACGTTLPAPPPPPPAPSNFTITITMATTGPGAGGTIASTPAGILATSPGTYSAPFPEFTVVTLTETPKNNRSRFTGWTQGCTGTTRACTIKVIADTPVGAAFTR